ncbi:ryanodine receptor 2 [Paragonimus westermani]|uniref:Ryanodine receptor 2 n=1 Tax=Paragonimus westermani TaxID=34504 RepID=A0A5J4NXI2_9TREM|nr:ryanodine receptor 2 [Paragonimus westermani]
MLAKSNRKTSAANGLQDGTCSFYLFAFTLQTPPPNMPPCVFILEQALSVRALQEMLSISSQGSDGAGQSGHKTLLYGHAIRLKHRDSNMYLACLSTSTSQDKLAFDVGLQATAENMVFGGDVVRLFHGDESLTVSAPDSEDVNPFVNPPSNGTVPGGPPNTTHRPSTANPSSLQNLPADCSIGVRQPVMYEIGAVSTSARSLWRIEHLKTKWSAGFFSWASEIRLRHVTTGRYLGVAPAEAQGSSHCDVITLSPHEASEAATIFLLRPTKDDKKRTEERGDEGMGEPDLRLGETLTYLQHAVSGRWLSYEAYETRKRGLGRVEEKKAVLLVEGHMDDLFTLVRAQDEEIKSAAAIRRCTAVFSSFVSTLRVIAHMHQPNFPGLQSTAQQPGPQSPAVLRLSNGILLGDVTQCLEDLIEFFAQPDPHEEHEVRQAKLAALRNRQNLFQNEGMIGCVLNTIEHFTGTFQTRREFSLVVGEDKSEQFDRLGNYLYLLLAALIRGNRENCAQFATPSRLDWLFNRLELQEGFAEGVLDALHCVLTDSDEALYLIHERHIRILISLLDKQGRDPRVLQALCSLCMGRQGGAVRLNQDLIYNTLLPQRDLLLQTKLVDQCGSMRPNIFVGVKEGGSMYPKWYFEVLIDTLETVTHQPAQIRVGWANTEGYDAQPGGGAGWGATSLGDDLYSYAFDGKFLWAGGKRKQASIGTEEAASGEAAGGLKIGDVIGCLLDLAGPVIQFNVNGRLVRGYFQDFNTTGLFYPCISMNAKTSARFLLGSNQGRLRHGPPPGYAPICDARQPGQRLRLEPVFSFGQLEKSVFTGPLASPTPQQSVFVPRTVRTSHIQLPNNVEIVRDRLAENLHDMWSMRKIDQGWRFGEVRLGFACAKCSVLKESRLHTNENRFTRRDDQQKLHPCLTTFNKLPNQDRQYNVTLAYETLRTIVGLGYNITYEPLPEGTRMKTIKLSNNFTQPNGYKPQPLDLSQIVLSKRLESLVNQLAENTHNMWARDRISLGWTYGFREDHAQKRSPHLVPFNEVDPIIKHSNRETAIETVKTLLAYGYSLDQVSTDSSDAARSNLGTDYSGQTRTYRGQVTRAVTRGKWYYEVEVLTSGFVHVGWVKKSARPDAIIGLKSGSYAFAAHQARKWHRVAAAYGSVCQPGDVIGCMLDMIDKTISFSLNGESMMDPLGLETAFKNIKTDEGYVPAFSLGSGQQVKVNFGNDVQTLKFFTFCGLQEGYKPLCVNMCRPMPMWYVRDDASLFKDVDSKHPTLQVIMSTGNTPTFKVMGKQADNGTSDEIHFLRLSLGTRCRDQFTTKSLKERHVHLDSLRRHVEPEPTHMLNSAAGDDPSSYNMMSSGMSSSALEIRDRRAKKTRLGNMFKKGKSRELGADVTSTVGGGAGGSLVSGGGSNLVSTGGKRGGQTQVAGGSIGPGPVTGGGGQSSAGSGSLVSGTPGSVVSGTHQGSQQTTQSQQPVSSEIMMTAVSSGQRPGGVHSSQAVGTSTVATGQSGMPGRSYGLDELDLLVPDASGHLSPIANIVDEFCFTVLVLPGQDPGLVHIGWVTNYFKLAKPPGPDSSSLSLLQEMQQPSTFDATTGQPFTQGVGGSQSAGHWANCVELFNVRQVAVCLLESDLTLKSAVAERASFMVNLGQLLSQVATPEDMGKRMSQGLSITCWVDVATGTLGFDLNGRDTGIRFQVEPSTRLFAAVFYRPTVREAIHFEFNRRNRYTLPITASMLRPPRQASIQPPHRLKVQALQRLHWARVPSRTVKMYSMKISEQRGWSTILEDHVSELAVQLPESGRCVTALELDEMVDLLKFHSHTLELYRALCCHANHNVAQSLTNHVDEHQLLHVLTAADIPGPLRSGFVELLLTMHVSSHVKLKEVTGKEFIVPLLRTGLTKPELLGAGSPEELDLEDQGPEDHDFDRIPAVREHVSIRPSLKTDPHLLIPGADGTGCMTLPAPPEKSKEEAVLNAALTAAGPGGLLKLADCPEFPINQLKQLCLTCLVDSVNKGGGIRDPAGGSFEHLLLPLLRIINCLLVMGTLDATDVNTVLAILDPKTFADARQLSAAIGGSLLDFPLPESVKLEICRLLHNLCDLQLRHRVEQVVQFSSTFVRDLQSDQYSRYMAIKLSNLPSSVAARRTREFRCPAAVQMASLLRMPGPGGPTGRLEEGVEVTPLPIDESVVVNEDESEGVETNRCAEEVKDLLRRFHQHLTDKLGVMKPESEEEPEINERGGVSSMADHTFGEIDHVYSITHAPDNLSLVSFAQVYPPDDLQTALARLPLVPPGMGNPEEGSGVPPWILKAAWDLLFRRRGPEDTTAEQAAIQSLEEANKLQQKRKSNLSDLIVHTIVKWARSGYIENLELIRAMFLALYRQYNAIEEVRDALGKTYVISSSSVDEVASLLRSLGRVRCLLGVQLGSSEEMLLKNCLWDLMNNKIFFQHPDLIRCLAVHETVMQLMVQTLTKATLDQPNANVGTQTQLTAGATSGSAGALGPSEVIAATVQAGTSLPAVQEENLALDISTQSEQRSVTGPTEMVVQCCRFLCYFCRTSRGNQKAMFEHLSYMLENSSMLLARPSLRGTCPLDVAYSSLMDNNELALALREKQLEKVAVYLSRCGVQSNAELLSKGYPDIGWDPVEGERFLDFLRFTVWVNGETVEENANLVVRLLIRRPECLGPALRGGSKTMKPQATLHGADGVELPPGGPGDTRDSGETLGSETENQQTSAGGGLLKAMKEGLVMSAQIKLVKMAQEAEAAGLNPEEEDLGWRTVMMDYEDANLFVPLPYNFESLPPEDNPDYIDLGAAILNFHSVLVNLLGHCAPELETTKSESLRARSILQSLVSMNDLEGVLSLRFILPPPKLEVQTNEDGAEEWVDKAGMPPGLLPDHKASVVLFLERVYGISDATTFLRLLENGFLPDLRAATLLDSAVVPDSDMALALNRYLCNNVLTLLTRHAHFLHEEGTAGGLFEATLQTAYRLSKCRAITNHQRDIVCEFLIALMQQIRPPMMTALLRKMAVDLHSLSSESVVSLRVLTEFYQRCGTYYTSDGWTDESGSTRAVGSSSEQEASKQSVGDSLSGGANRGAGSGGESIATEEERNLTAQLFIIIFDNLSRQPYEPVLFSYALPCLCAIGCALPPDYSISRLNANDPRAALGQEAEEGGFSAFSAAIDSLLAPGGPRMDGVDQQEEAHHDVFIPKPVDTTQIRLPNTLHTLVDRFAQHCHDSWALELIEQGYTYGPVVDEGKRTHPNLCSFNNLPQHEQVRYIHPVTDTLKAMLAFGWSIDADDARHHETSMDNQQIRRQTITADTYNPTPRDLRGVNVSKEMLNLAEILADNAHNIWARQKMSDLEAIGGGVHQLLVPYEILTDNERKRYRRLTHELIKYLQYQGYRLTYRTGAGAQQPQSAISALGMADLSVADSSQRMDGRSIQPSARFAFGLLCKLLDYVESAMSSVHETVPSNRFSFNRACITSSHDMKFFVKVVLPLVERYFETQHSYFLDPMTGASLQEKKMAATHVLFFTNNVFQLNVNFFVHLVDIHMFLFCFLRAILKMGNAEDFIRSRLLPFFVNCADDLCILMRNLDAGRYSHTKCVGVFASHVQANDLIDHLLPLSEVSLAHSFTPPSFSAFNSTVLSRTFVDEVGNVQVTCYRILHALYKLGTTSAKHAQRHRAQVGECLAALAAAFPVAFLEPDLNRNNPLSITYDNRGGDFSLEARDVLHELSQTLASLPDIIQQVECLADSGIAGAAETPHLIEVTLPLLCSYLPVWWRKGPECVKQTNLNESRAAPEIAQSAHRTTAVDPGDLQGKSNFRDRMSSTTGPLTTVTADLMNRVLGSVLQLIQNNIDSPNAPWMTRIATRTQPIVANSTADMLGQYFLPVSERLLEHALIVEKVEETFKLEKRGGSETVGEREEELASLVEVLVRNLFAFYPLLIKFVDRHRTAWLKHPTQETQRLFTAVARMFLIWARATKFRREEENFVSQHEIDHLSLIVPSGGSSVTSNRGRSTITSCRNDAGPVKPSKRTKGSSHTSLTVACIKRLLPIGLSQLGGREQELVLCAKRKLIRNEADADIENYLLAALDREEDVSCQLCGIAFHYSDVTCVYTVQCTNTSDPHDMLGSHCFPSGGLRNPGSGHLVEPIRHSLSDSGMTCGYTGGQITPQVDHPPTTAKGAWKKLVSSQRKRAVMACFRMVPLYALPVHRAVNLFIRAYIDEWLNYEESLGVKLIEDITSEEGVTGTTEVDTASSGVITQSAAKSSSNYQLDTTFKSIEDSAASHAFEFMDSILDLSVETEPQDLSDGSGKSVVLTVAGSTSGSATAPSPDSASGGTEVAVGPDPLTQLLTALSRSAMEQAPDDPLYLAYARIMGKSCSGKDEEEEEEEEEEEGATFQDQEEQKLQLLSEQNRLADRGAAEMVLLQLAASRGEVTPVAQASIELGIALLLGGNVSVQSRMLEYLNRKKLSGFFTSLAGLMQSCSVLDLDTFERCNKAEGLAVGLSDMKGITNLYDADFTCKIFRFLQLLCEGHNLAFQDYLRTQAGNTVSVNLIISTVDYLLRLQESIMDFYWHYSNKETIDDSGKSSFVKAIKIGKQVFRSLTEYIQGPCLGNQLALAHSRLWDAVGGFIYVSAQMQDKLSRDPDQLDLLREFLNLQKELMIMLLSMLEGNVVNGPIARQMVDTLAESSAYVEMILKFFDIFLRMKAITTSDAFLAFDVNGDGWISHREFRAALEQQKTYTAEEIGYIIACVDTNADGKVDFKEFTERFYNPAEDIGFNFALLLTNLSEHVPFDPRLERLVGKARGVLDVFEPHLGRIEITGSNGRIERVYFEIRQQHIDQWEAPQIKESKRSFLHSVVGESGDKEKLEYFVNFCEDTIFEMQHAQEINGDEADVTLGRTAAFNRFLEITHLALIGRAFAALFGCLRPSHLASGWAKLRQMTFSDIILALLGLQIGILICLGRFTTFCLNLIWQIIVAMASDNTDREPSLSRFKGIRAILPGSPGGSIPLPPPQEHQWWLLSEEQQLLLERVDPTELAAMEEDYARAHSVAMVSAAISSQMSDLSGIASKNQTNGCSGGIRQSTGLTTANLVMGPPAQRAVLKPIPVPSASSKAEADKTAEKVPQFNTRRYFISLFASNFYRFKISALILAFVINFLLLFFKVHHASAENGSDEGVAETAANMGSEAARMAAELLTKQSTSDSGDGGPETGEPDEWITLADSNSYIAPLIATLAVVHTLLSFSTLVAYYYLKVPLVIFKREKEISRMLEFEGMWISTQPADDNLRAHWDKLVLSTPSFPQMYWGKFVKKKVRNKYSVQYDYDEITVLLGMDKPVPESTGTAGNSFFSMFSDVDFQYLTWKWGVVFTDISFLYLAVYFAASFFGNFNYFLYACHLLDVAVSFKTLRTIIQSVTHNGKQLVLTVMLTSIVIYMYTVIAFNFFRKFYVKDNDGVQDAKCNDMMTCFIFHLHTGLRAGGGIGDEIEPPDGDEWENSRILFDLTFFFFVIIILLAIIQGLIIDAFGDLRDQLEQVKEDLESKCFICGIGKEYFEKFPHGFEQHVEKEHNFANYMYFLMHIINKPDTEYTGQETYVWELYQQRCWDFFPIGDCFRKQYEEELQPK